MNVFISYSTKDSTIANLLKYILELKNDNNIQCFIYQQQQLPLNRSVPENVENAIREADIFVVLLTKFSQESQWVQQEIGFARACGKRILPLAVGEGIQPIAMIRDNRTIYLGNWRDFSIMIDHLPRVLLSMANNSEDSQTTFELDRIIIGANDRTKFITEQFQRLLEDRNRELVICNQAVFSAFAVSDTPEYRAGEPDNSSEEYMSLLLKEKRLLQRIIDQPRTTFKLLLCPVPFGYRDDSIRYDTLLDWMYKCQNLSNVDYCCGNYLIPNRLIVSDEFCVEAPFNSSKGYEYNIITYDPEKITKAKQDFDSIYEQAFETNDAKETAIQKIRLRRIVNDLISLF